MYWHSNSVDVRINYRDKEGQSWNVNMVQQRQRRGTLALATKEVWLPSTSNWRLSLSDSKCLNSSPIPQLAFLKMVQQLLLFHSVSPSTSASRERADRWHSGKSLTQNRGPHWLRLSLYISFRSRRCLHECLRVWLGGRFTLKSGWTGGITRHAERQREICGLSQQTKRAWVCVWERRGVNEITCSQTLALHVPSRDRTSHVRFQNSSQLLLHKDGHILNAIFAATKGGFCSSRVQLL